MSEFRISENHYDGWRILIGIVLSLALGFVFGFSVAYGSSCALHFFPHYLG